MPTVTSSTRRRVGLLAFLGPLLTPPSHGSCGGLTISCHLHHAFHRSSSSRGRRALQPRPRLRLRPVCAPSFPICKTPASLLIPGSAAPRFLSLASPASWSSHGRLLVGVRAPPHLACSSPTSRISVKYYPSSQTRLRPGASHGALCGAARNAGQPTRMGNERQLAGGSAPRSPTRPITGRRGGPVRLLGSNARSVNDAHVPARALPPDSGKLRPAESVAHV